MTGKDAISRIADKCAKKKYDAFGNLIFWQGTIDKEVIAVENDLNKYEVLKDFVKRFIQFTPVYDDIDHYEVIPVQQYIGNSGCLLLTEEKMQKILEAIE